MFHPAHADAWAHTLTTGIDHLTRHLGKVGGPSTGTPPELAAKLVADVDLDSPLGEVAPALAVLSRLYLDDALWFPEPGYAAHLNFPVVSPAPLPDLFIHPVNPSSSPSPHNIDN